MAFPANIEQWRIIDGYDNYEISSHGRVRNNQSGRILKNCIITGGYYRVKLCKNGKQTAQLVHRLVCFAFCENPNNYAVVDHMDRNRTNNMFNNLRWCTLSENNRNTTIRTDNTSGNKGVVKHLNSWQAQWYNNNK